MWHESGKSDFITGLLAIHGANCYAQKLPEHAEEAEQAGGSGSQSTQPSAIDKAPFARRLKWVEDNESNIIALGTRGENFWPLPEPLEKWWLEADKPWAFLAWARDWALYRKDPENHNSHLPVEVDGSCNGYQHIAALLRCGTIAKHVNMAPEFSPADIYTFINSCIESSNKFLRNEQYQHFKFPEWLEAMKRMKKENRELPDNLRLMNARYQLAHTAEGRISRNSIKKGIMTYPYSATAYTLAQQMKENDDVFHNWDSAEIDPDSYEENQPSSHYDPILIFSRARMRYAFAEIIHAEIEDRFPPVKNLLEWLKKLAEAGFKEDDYIEWIAPTKFHVIQDCRVIKNVRISVMSKKHHYNCRTDKQDMKKHINSLGPNLIHSLDAAHMMRTVNAALSRGITSFRMVHDSYATHAADIPLLSRLLREEFIKLYDGSELLRDFNTQVLRNAPNAVELEPPPLSNDLDMRSIINCEYFFA